jgi:hypothetical protein
MDAAPLTWQLARETIARIDPEPWIVDLRGEEGEEAVF